MVEILPEKVMDLEGTQDVNHSTTGWLIRIRLDCQFFYYRLILTPIVLWARLRQNEFGCSSSQ